MKFCYYLRVCCTVLVTLQTMNYIHRLVYMCVDNRCELRVMRHVEDILLS